MCCVVQMRAQVHEGDDMTHVIGVMHYILAQQYCSSVDKKRIVETYNLDHDSKVSVYAVNQFTTLLKSRLPDRRLTEGERVLTISCAHVCLLVLIVIVFVVRNSWRFGCSLGLDYWAS